LWEYFLVEKLQFGWEEVHEIAEELEHISSKKLIDRLDDFLGNPRKDPHGDPIPDANGKMPVLQLISLDSIELNKPMEITGIGNQTPELMELLQRTNIKIGSKLEVKKKFSFDNSLEIKMRNAAPFIISQFLAKNLLVNDEE
jgi:DtxR family Mn-dependent transcriptional regulator